MRITEISIPLEALRAILPDESGGIKITLHEGYSLLDYLGGARDGAAGSASPGKEGSGGRMLFGVELLDRNRIRYAGAVVKLSNLQYQILASLIRHHGSVSFLDLAEEAWDDELTEPGAIHVAIYKLNRKLSALAIPFQVRTEKEIAHLTPKGK